MANRKRDILTISLVITLAVISFAAGYLINEVFEVRFGRSNFSANNEEFGLFWEAWSKVESSFIGTIPSDKQVTYGAVRGAINVLDDPYTIFIEPSARDRERESLRGNFGGVGALLERREDGKIYLSPMPGNPAANEGVLEGDILVAVDGLEILETMTVQDVANLVRGEVGTEVVLTILHPDTSKTEEISIIREVILLPSVAYRIMEEAPELGYLELSRFSGESSDEVEDALTYFLENGIEKIIIDVRQNGGGLLEAAVSVSDHFIQSGPIVYQVTRSDDERIFEATSETIAGEMELVVLIDSGTASAAEIFAGALRDHERATLIGTTTFGKGSVQLVYDLSDGSSVHVTSARWYTPNRFQIDQHGLEPDIPIEMSTEEHAQGQDVILETAIKVLTGVVEKRDNDVG